MVCPCYNRVTNESGMLNKKIKISLGILFGIATVVATTLYLQNYNVEVLNPKGDIAYRQRELIIFATLLALIVILPVFVLTITFAYKYRATNTKAKYTPDVHGNRKLETVWWGIPIAIIGVLSVVTWITSHSLDPFKPLDSDVTPITVEVVALQWKWLFIYPEQNIATVNYIQIPVNTPVNFKITADAPMNSFWIPQLGGQIYAMSGMSTQLNLIANAAGNYNGSSANISGEGFAGMRFIANASTVDDFDAFVNKARQSPEVLDSETYSQLAEPSKNNPASAYASVKPGLYASIIDKYMPSGHSVSDKSMSGNMYK